MSLNDFFNIEVERLKSAGCRCLKPKLNYSAKQDLKCSTCGVKARKFPSKLSLSVLPPDQALDNFRF